MAKSKHINKTATKQWLRPTMHDTDIVLWPFMDKKWGSIWHGSPMVN